jgi:general secretion pathway protein D
MTTMLAHMKLAPNYLCRYVVAFVLFLSGCTAIDVMKMPESRVITPVAAATQTRSAPVVQQASPPSDSSNQKTAEPTKRIFPGTGRLMQNVPARTPSPAGDLVFNFENTDVREVVRSILGDILKENYLIDPAVIGSVSMRMARGITRPDLIPVLESILRQANAILVRDGSLWRVLPASAGIRGIGRPAYLARQATAGYGMTLIPLKYIGVNEMMRLLDALVKEPTGQGGAGGSVRPEPLRNMLIVTGTPSEQNYLLETIEMFDVDWMAGMSAGLFTLEHSDAKKVLEEVDKVFGGLGQGAPGAPGAPAGGLGPMFGLVRVQLIERLNALLVISPQPHILEQAEAWIRRLDRGGSADSTRLYVYNLQYTNAEKLAPILQSAMQGRAGPTTAPVAQTAPGQNPLNIATPVAIPSPTSPNQPAAVPVPTRVQPNPTNGGAGGTGQGTALARNATITADKDRNALLITATPSEYSAIEQAIKKLDLLPRQVMVEVTILEVDLTDEFSLGVEWAARQQSNPPKTNYADSTATLGSAGVVFSLANKTIAGNILQLLDAKLSANDGNKRARINASPKLMAVDNTPVTFNVGRSVSVQTGTVSTPGATNTNNSTSSTFQYLQTGISVSITPRISAGGLVNLEITQEISEPTPSSIAGNTNPDISKTALKNTVLAQDGETIVMAGLIREKVTDSSNGLPGVSRVPFLGSLFGKQGFNVDKQELLVLVRPVVINSIDQARDASDEIRNKMLRIKDAFGDAAHLQPRANATAPLLPTSEATENGSSTKLRITQEIGRRIEGDTTAAP